jgi:hypothetical protein
LAYRLGWDPALVRGLFVVAALFSGVGLLLYGLGWLLWPEASDGRIHLEEAIRGRVSAGFWGGAIAAAGGFIYTLVSISVVFPVGFMWTALVSAAAVILIAYAVNRHPVAGPWAQPPGPVPGPASGPMPGQAPPPPPPAPAPVPAVPAPVPANAAVPVASPTSSQETTMNAENDGAKTSEDATAESATAGSIAEAATTDVISESAGASEPVEPETERLTEVAPEPPTEPLTPVMAAAPSTDKPDAATTETTPTLPPDQTASSKPATAAPPTQPVVVPAASRPSGRAKGGPVTVALIGLMLLMIAGAVAIGRYTNWLDSFVIVAFCFGLTLTMMGVGLVILGLMGRRSGSFVAASIVLAVLAVPVVTGAEAISTANGSWSVGSYDYRPANAGAASRGYSQAVGDLVVDLTDPAIADHQDLTVDVSLGIGETTLVLPHDRPVILIASVTTGQIELDGFDSDEWSVGWSDLRARHRSSSPHNSPAYGWDHWNWDDAGSSGGGIKVAVTARNKAASSDAPALTVNYSGFIGSLRVIEYS